MVRNPSITRGLTIKSKKVMKLDEEGQSRNLDHVKKDDQAEVGSTESKLVAAEAMLLQNWANFIVTKIREGSKDYQ